MAVLAPSPNQLSTNQTKRKKRSVHQSNSNKPSITRKHSSCRENALEPPFRFDQPVSLGGTVTSEFHWYINLSVRRYTYIYCNPNTSHRPLENGGFSGVSSAPLSPPASQQCAIYSGSLLANRCLTLFPLPHQKQEGRRTRVCHGP